MIQTEFRLAVISDIHGNLLALEAVWADICRRGADLIINLGDSLYGPLDPAGTCDFLIEHQIPSVCGNQDRVILNSPPAKSPAQSLEFVLNQLKSSHVDWLKSLPPTRVLAAYFFACHGTPLRDDIYLTSQVSLTGIQARLGEYVEILIQDVVQPVILCGHDHRPQTILLSKGQLVVNPGSVGLPAYTDDEPFVHSIDNGSPHARYSVLNRIGIDWQIENIAVPYDWKSAARTAGKNGRPDWEIWLRTGRA